MTKKAVEFYYPEIRSQLKNQFFTYFALYLNDQNAFAYSTLLQLKDSSVKSTELWQKMFLSQILQTIEKTGFYEGTLDEKTNQEIGEALEMFEEFLLAIVGFINIDIDPKVISCSILAQLKSLEKPDPFEFSQSNHLQ